MSELRVIHPFVFLLEDEMPYGDDIKNIIADLKVVFGNDFIHCESFSVTAEQLESIRPSAELKNTSESKGIKLSYPIIIPIVALEKEETHEKFFKFLELLDNKKGVFKSDEGTDYRFLNIFIRNLKRIIYNDLSNPSFYDTFENYCQEKNIPIINFFNVIIDKFAENNLDRLEQSSLIFKQLSSFLMLVYESESIDSLGLSHSAQASSVEQQSSIRYNSIGMASIGIHHEKIIENIKLRRKRSFLEEVLHKREITDDNYLEINKRSRDEIINNYSSFQMDVKKQVLCYSFESKTSHLFELYETEQEKNNLYLLAEDATGETQRMVQKIDEQSVESTREIELIEEEAIRFKQQILENYQSYVDKYITELLDYDKQLNSFEIVIYGLLSLLKKQKLHVVTQQDSVTYDTISELKNKVSQKPLKKKTISDGEREKIKQELSQKDKKIENQYTLLKSEERQLDIRWITRSFKNLILIPIIGLVLCGGLSYFYSVSIGVIAFVVLGVIGLIKAFILKQKVKKIKEKLASLLQDKKGIIKKYVNTYSVYFNLIQDHIAARETKEIYEDISEFINKQKNQVELFRDALKNILDDCINEYQTLELSEDIFNRSLLSENDLEYFCKKNELYFFNTSKLSVYFEQFLQNDSQFNALQYSKVSDKLEENEYIHPNEQHYNSEIHFYKNIEKIKTQIFVKGKQNSKTISCLDVSQGAVGDCYFLAALAGISNKKPQYIQNKIKTLDDKVTVEFYNEKSKSRIVEVDHKFWVNEMDLPIYAQLTNSVEETYESWVLYVEKAWAKINGLSYTKINGDNISGTARAIDYSLALTGRKAIRERLMPTSTSNKYHERIEEHHKNKPVILYSLGEVLENSRDDIIRNHAFALLAINDDSYIVYDPHGKKITFKREELKYNFDLILYFDFEEQRDEHLRGIYAEYFHNPETITLLQDFDEKIEKHLQIHYYDKSLEDLLVSFDISIDETKSKDFASKLLRTSVPYVYTKKAYNNNYTVFLFGDNIMINNEIKTVLKNVGVPRKNISVMTGVERRIGVLKIHYNLVKNNVK